MEDLLERARSLRMRAKNLRSRGRYEDAIAVIQESIDSLEKEFTTTSSGDRRSDIARELFESLGFMGGTERRWALEIMDKDDRYRHLCASIKAYDWGFELESNPEFGISGTYNRLNRLISRIFCVPSSFDNVEDAPRYEDIEALDIQDELRTVQIALEKQLVVTRRDDDWALLDKALADILLDEANAYIAYREFFGRARPLYCYRSALDTLQPLSELDLPMSANLQDAAKQMESHLETA